MDAVSVKVEPSEFRRREVAERRRSPIGAEMLRDGVSFRVWAPSRRRVCAVVESGELGGSVVPLQRERDGYFSAVVVGADAGDRYRFRLDDDEKLYPDPASRFQPEGPHGPSQIIDPSTFDWSDRGWTGPRHHGQVIYEMHVGTFTSEGTWASAIEKLPHLADVGITLLEVMPLADFSGDFGWGYDGVNMFAPSRLYGTPDDLRRFVDRAHALKVGVILDVVYNHFGPDGNYVGSFSPYYASDRHKTDWGAALNFDGEHSAPVREFITTNAAYWIDEFHLDGLRLDATQDIYDSSSDHIIAALARSAREAAGKRSIFLVGENEPQHVIQVRSPDDGGYGLDALWNDDLHHTAMVALTGRSEAYYTDYRGTPQEFISAFKRGYLYQGQQYAWQKKRRGTPSRGVDAASFVTFVQNHDQIANSGLGQRSHVLCCAARHRAMTGLILLAPGTPMLFQGQEFAASTPFVYFAAHQEPLAKMVRDGRKEFLAQFPSLGSPGVQDRVPDPAERATFERCKLDWSEWETHSEAVTLHRDLLALRRDDPLLASPSTVIDGAVLSEAAFLIRFFGDEASDRLLLVNFGNDVDLSPAPEPLLAEPEEHAWEIVFSSEDPKYGGTGTPSVCDDGRWFLPANSATFMISRRSQP